MPTYPFQQMPEVVNSKVQAFNKAMDVATALIVMAGVGEMADATPVDTTRAVSNWLVTRNSPASKEVPPHIKGSVKGSGASAARQKTKLNASASVTGYRNLKTVYITNNVPYISVLNYGDQKHFPANMVERGLQAMKVRASSIEVFGDF